MSNFDTEWCEYCGDIFVAEEIYTCGDCEGCYCEGCLEDHDCEGE